jgi:hypothetical protein
MRGRLVVAEARHGVTALARGDPTTSPPVPAEAIRRRRCADPPRCAKPHRPDQSQPPQTARLLAGGRPPATSTATCDGPSSLPRPSTGSRHAGNPRCRGGRTGGGRDRPARTASPRRPPAPSQAVDHLRPARQPATDPAACNGPGRAGGRRRPSTGSRHAGSPRSGGGRTGGGRGRPARTSGCSGTAGSAARRRRSGPAGTCVAGQPRRQPTRVARAGPDGTRPPASATRAAPGRSPAPRARRSSPSPAPAC